MVAVEQVKPTRMELLNIKEKIKLSEKGHKLLKQKRDVLILEFFAIFEKARDIRSELNAQMAKAFTSLAIAQVYHGIFEIESASLAVKKAPGVRVTVRNVMGVKIPKVESSYVKKGLMDRGYGLLGSSAKIDEAAESFEGALDTIIKLSETETALKRLIEETEKTKRRVNALEYVILPRFKEQAKYINMRL
ncbi:MAG: V-type ATP synthase subunit D, partial [Candidatus Micrarchaeota archaeon]|nr:V-type ATP synthase subunit D [Candidatus Micrarchaeota archaeon]